MRNLFLPLRESTRLAIVALVVASLSVVPALKRHRWRDHLSENQAIAQSATLSDSLGYRSQGSVTVSMVPGPKREAGRFWLVEAAHTDGSATSLIWNSQTGRLLLLSAIPAPHEANWPVNTRDTARRLAVEYLQRVSPWAKTHLCRMGVVNRAHGTWTADATVGDVKTSARATASLKIDRRTGRLTFAFLPYKLRSRHAPV